MDEKLTRPFQPAVEEEIVKSLWNQHQLANPDATDQLWKSQKNAQTFSMVLPPPNVTGTLHMGHAAMLAIEDIMVRFHRMQGFRTLWVPGVDHAAIATQAKVEKELEKEGLRKHELGRDAFLDRVKAFAQESHDTIVNQITMMGASVDWSREAYTLDAKRELAVRTAFKSMYDDGLIYRGHRLVNWDPKLQTTVSDDEIDYVDRTDQFYYLNYGPFVIGTSRPETKFGDKYVVMHPDDERYAKYAHGSQIALEWINGPITATIIKDESIDKEFGTGVMTITPWHDAIDFDIAERHKLEKEQVIDERGKLLPIAGEFAGLSISKARPLIIEKLKQKGLVSKVEEKYVHRVATNSRGGGTIEPQIKEQWFIDVNKTFPFPHGSLEGIKKGEQVSLKALMRHVIDAQLVDILPDRFGKVYLHWIDNLRDWCISRQIWFGHRIPVWYKGSDRHVGVSAPDGEGWIQDPDTLDTWFSSGLWTFSTLGWPEHTDDFKTYHPTSVLETGYDILFFWVARMILMTTYLVGTVPFKTVYMHGLVRDGQGRKMSKSLGNIIDPLDMIAKYGADATRISLIIGTGPGNDLKLSEDKIKGYKHFANKIWNASRFVITEAEGYVPGTATLNATDQTTYDTFLALSKEVTEDIEHFRYYLAGEKLYQYFWHTFADVIIEETKARTRGTDAGEKASAQELLIRLLRAQLILLHPFMPFVTESLWQVLPKGIRGTTALLAKTPWPVN